MRIDLSKPCKNGHLERYIDSRGKVACRGCNRMNMRRQRLSKPCKRGHDVSQRFVRGDGHVCCRQCNRERYHRTRTNMDACCSACGDVACRDYACFYDKNSPGWQRLRQERVLLVRDVSYEGGSWFSEHRLHIQPED